MQAWPVVSQTALASTFLQNMMRLMFPDEGESYAEMLQTGDQKNALLQQLMQIVNALVVDQETGQLNEDAQPFADKLQMIQSQVQDVLGTDDKGTPTPTG